MGGRLLPIPLAVAGTDLDVKVTGTAAANIDFTDFLARRVFLLSLPGSHHS